MESDPITLMHERWAGTTVKKLPHCDSSFAFVYKLYDAQLMFIISHHVDRISYYGMIEFAPSTMTLWPEK